MFITRPEILSIDIGNNQQLEVKHEFDFFNFIITLENGNRVPLITYVNDFREEVRLKNKEAEKITKHYKIEKAVLSNRQTNVSVKLNGITFTGQLTKIDAGKKIEFTLVDQVWLIMKSTFDERTFTFTDNGLIMEHKK